MENDNFQFNSEAAGGHLLPEEPRGAAPAGFSERFLAYAIDAAPFVAGAYVTFLLMVRSGVVEYSAAAGIGCKLLWILPYLAYETLFSSGGRATIGKYLLGIRVRAADGSDLSVPKAFIRSVSYFVSAAILNLGYLMALFTPEKRALHDYLGGSRVISIKERGEWADGLVLAVSWALMAMLTGSWINNNFLRLTPEAKEKVVMAETTVSKIAKLEEIHKFKYGRYTEDMTRLAALTGNPDAVRREIMRTLEPGTLTLATDGRAYVVSGKAKNWLKTEVSATSLPPQKQ